MQNLRNKYSKHSIVKPLIEHCEKQNLSFEFVKANEKILQREKSFYHLNEYYIKIGNTVLNTNRNAYCGSSLISLFMKAYSHLNIDCPDSLSKASNVFSR